MEVVASNRTTLSTSQVIISASHEFSSPSKPKGFTYCPFQLRRSRSSEELGRSLCGSINSDRRSLIHFWRQQCTPQGAEGFLLSQSIGYMCTESQYENAQVLRWHTLLPVLAETRGGRAGGQILSHKCIAWQGPILTHRAASE